MKISINGEVKQINEANCDLDIFNLIHLIKVRPPFAIALNGEFIAQENYSSTSLSENDKIDIVSPIFGG